MLRMVNWSKITPNFFQNCPPGPKFENLLRRFSRKPLAQSVPNFHTTFVLLMSRCGSRFGQKYVKLPILQAKTWFGAKNILKRAENRQNLVGSRKYWNCTCKIIILRSPENFRSNGQLFQEIFSAKKKNKPKIYGFPFPGVTFLMDHSIFDGTKFQVWQNALAKWFLFLSYMNKWKKICCPTDFTLFYVFTPVFTFLPPQFFYPRICQKPKIRFWSLLDNRKCLRGGWAHFEIRRQSGVM